MASANPEVQVVVRGNIDRWFRYGLVVTALFIPINLAIGFLRFKDVGESEQPLIWLRYFDLGEELTLPAWATASLLVVASVVSLAAAQRFDEPVMRRGFRVLTVVMLYLSLDEATQLHERTTDPLREAFNLGGILYWSWVIPAAAAVVLVGALLFRFVLSLPRSSALPLVVAGGMYVLCALGLELVEGYFFDAGGASAATDILSMIEEVGEIVAVMLYIRTVSFLASSGFEGLEGNSFPSILREERPSVGSVASE